MRDTGANEPHQSDGSDRVVSLGDIPLHSTNLLSLLDEDGVIRYQSPSIARLCGFEQADLVDIPCTECFHPDDRDRVFSAFENVVSSDEFVVEAVEYRHLKADGTYLWVESVASSNPTSNGYYVINTRDISERKHHQKELERANERLQEFASVVSHDLRNPLAVAQGYLELAEGDAPTEHHTKISDALDRMATLIDSLLMNARGETRGVEVEPVDLSRLAETCWQNVVSKDATLHTDFDRPLNADPLHLTQLLENLFRNAIDHGRDDVAITLGALDDGFYVEDNGSGIPAAERGRIFEPGYTSSASGTGLGLSIVHQVVDSHQWSIQITESSSGGARFEITDAEFAQ
jgi:PAS domain S-box-containing protein